MHLIKLLNSQFKSFIHLLKILQKNWDNFEYVLRIFKKQKHICTFEIPALGFGQTTSDHFLFIDLLIPQFCNPFFTQCQIAQRSCDPECYTPLDDLGRAPN